MFEISRISQIISRRYQIEESVFKASLNTNKFKGMKIKDLFVQLGKMFEAMLLQASTDFDDNDLARLAISHRELDSDIVVHLRSKNKVTPQVILDR